MIRQQIINFKCIARSEPQDVQIEIHPTGLNQKRIEVDHHEDEVAPIRRAFGVADERGIVRGVEVQPFVALERRVGQPDLVQVSDQRF